MNNYRCVEFDADSIGVVRRAFGVVVGEDPMSMHLSGSMRWAPSPYATPGVELIRIISVA